MCAQSPIFPRSCAPPSRPCLFRSEPDLHDPAGWSEPSPLLSRGAVAVVSTDLGLTRTRAHSAGTLRAWCLLERRAPAYAPGLSADLAKSSALEMAGFLVHRY